MILKEVPDDFNPEIEVVGCYVMVGDSFLVLQRNNDKTHAATWGLPAGKVEPGETKKEAMVREVAEETGLKINEAKLDFIESVAVRHNGHDINFHMYRFNVISKPKVTLRINEHQNYKWVTINKLKELDCVHDLIECSEITLEV